MEVSPSANLQQNEEPEEDDTGLEAARNSTFAMGFGW